LAHAEDDYDFDYDDEGGEQQGAQEGDAGEDDFNFDEPVDASGGSGSSGPSFLQGDEEEIRDTPQPRKKLTPEEIEAVRRAENERVWVLQRRPFLKSDRFELNTTLGQNINDPLIDFYTLNLQANYYLNEQMAIGLRGTYTLNTETRAFNSVIQDYQLFPQVSRPIWSSSLNFQYTPLYGKFSLFQTWIFPWELSARGGVGWIQTFIDGHVLVTLGATQQFFLNRWLAFNIDLDYQLFQEVTSLESDEGTLLSNLVLGAGVSIYFPLDFEYKELK
jgi:outer membrane beta-barrel protein